MPRRLVVVLFLVAVALGLIAPAASADQTPTLTTTLGALWTKVLETPSSQNPFGSGGSKASPCWNLGGTIAPLAPTPVKSCMVSPSTKIFVAASTAECSTFPNDCAATSPPAGQLAGLARQSVDPTAPTVTVDGAAVAVTNEQTQQMPIVLPQGNLFGQPSGSTGKSVALGWVALLNPLPLGSHSIHVVTDKQNYTTTIVVNQGS